MNFRAKLNSIVRVYAPGTKGRAKLRKSSKGTEIILI
jgi:hypothetical protein